MRRGTPEADKGLLMTQGIRDFEPARRNWHERLAGLRAGDAQDLPPVLKALTAKEWKMPPRKWCMAKAQVGHSVRGAFRFGLMTTAPTRNS
jgi:hypothetical protein